MVSFKKCSAASILVLGLILGPTYAGRSGHSPSPQTVTDASTYTYDYKSSRDTQDKPETVSVYTGGKNYDNYHNYNRANDYASNFVYSAGSYYRSSGSAHYSGSSSGGGSGQGIPPTVLVFFGVALIIIGILSLKKTETEFTMDQQYMDEVFQEVKEDVNPSEPLPGNNEKLVHMKGKLVTNLNQVDSEFDVQINCFKLFRKVEILQWVETKTVHNKGEPNERTDFTYTKEWGQHIVSHHSFVDKRKQNMPSIPLQTYASPTCKTAHLGSFQFGPSYIEKYIILASRQRFDIQKIYNVQLLGFFAEKMAQLGYINCKCEDNYLYANTNLENDQINQANRIGQVRVSWEYVETGNISVMAKQICDEQKGIHSLGDFKLKKSKRSINKIEKGHTSARDIMNNEKDSMKKTVNMGRCFFIVLFIVGIALVVCNMKSAFEPEKAMAGSAENSAGNSTTNNKTQEL